MHVAPSAFEWAAKKVPVSSSAFAVVGFAVAISADVHWDAAVTSTGTS